MSLPEAFVERIQSQFGRQAITFLEALQQSPATSVRLNPYKPVSIDGEPVPWYNKGFFLTQRPVFSLDPRFHGGAYYVQEASSMFLSAAMQHVKEITGSAPVTVLDACAAPGGKSTLILDFLSMDDVLLANEVVQPRNAVLQENLMKWGNPAYMVSRAEMAALGKCTNTFDVMVVDAPCSGEGLFRKDPDSMQQWNPANAQMCSHRQLDILIHLWPALKPGGWLVYSTCTFNPDENERLMQQISDETGAENITLTLPPALNTLSFKTGQLTAYRFLPHQVKGEGFFMCVLRKPGQWQPAKNTVKAKTDPLGLPFANWLPVEQLNFYTLHDSVFFRTPAAQQLFELLAKKVYFTKSGIEAGKVFKQQAAPSFELAWSNLLNRAYLTTAEMDETSALAYLRKETNFAVNAPNGYVLLTFKGIALGWIKHLGNRFNNLYPQAYRLRM